VVPRPQAPSCLVLDVNLPGLSGLDVQEELAKSGAQIPIIFLTGTPVHRLRDEVRSKEDIDRVADFEGIIGQSRALQEVLRLVDMVAPCSCWGRRAAARN
jgi:DNA-binding NtrC family response regulator